MGLSQDDIVMRAGVTLLAVALLVMVGLPLWSADTHSPSEGEAHSQTPP